MATCPRDGAAIQVDYGMATCPVCGVMLFIDMDGVAQLGATADADAETPALPAEEEELEFSEVTQIIDDLESEVEVVESEVVEPEFQEISMDPDPVISPGDPLGIQGFANSEISSAKDGPTLIRMLISGIDTKEIRESLREAITDSRFGWDVDAIMSSIAKGELRIENVSPVKASIAVNRIKRMPVRIRWEQYAVTQAEQL